MKKRNFIYLTMVFFLLSCGKKRTITGKVYNPVTGETYQGITIAVLRDKNCISFDGCGEKVHKTTTTNSNGEFSLSFYRKGGDHIIINYDGDKFYSERGHQIFEEIEDIDFPIVPYGNLQNRIVNMDCFDENDELKITEKYHTSLPNFDVFFPGVSFVTYDGCIDNTYSVNPYPMGWRVWKGTVTKNNVTTPFADSVYVPEGGDVLWEIEW